VLRSVEAVEQATEHNPMQVGRFAAACAGFKAVLVLLTADPQLAAFPCQTLW
jgi:hypothetical protein